MRRIPPDSSERIRPSDLKIGRWELWTTRHNEAKKEEDATMITPHTLDRWISRVNLSEPIMIYSASSTTLISAVLRHVGTDCSHPTRRSCSPMLPAPLSRFRACITSEWGRASANQLFCCQKRASDLEVLAFSPH